MASWPWKALNKNIETLLKKETLALVFSCEFCEISKNTFFYRTPLMAAFDFCFFFTSEEIKYSSNLAASFDFALTDFLFW